MIDKPNTTEKLNTIEKPLRQENGYDRNLKYYLI